ncbi:ABC transporter permease [Chitinophaga sp. GCM10012297]|uniref:ABC transporter permease n=1 Tax=Chitinophaga chungangae TaxID=2821488 RepID=A0ABS3YG33_9BACT|nr:ABC transporter permease [Chitinophaga chungangae]MBO9153647.1 ABC transporter permease [Chitinophaga chungangae]
MIRNYLKTAFRNVWKNKTYALINVVGLAIGMTACFFIFQYTWFERSYDQFHDRHDRLYRVPISYTGSFGGGKPLASNHPAVGPAMMAEFPEVENAARLVRSGVFVKTSTLSYTDAKGNVKRFIEPESYFADPSFLEMFSFPFSAGNAATALQDPNSIVITSSIARKYFGDEDPISKVLEVNGRPLKVTAVLKDVPENSHVRFNILIPLSIIDKDFGLNEWGWPEFYNYVQLRPGADPAKVAARFPAFIDQHLGAKMKELNFRSHFHLQPVTDIHLRSGFTNEPEVSGNERTVNFMIILGVFLLVIAWINYINLSTAKSMERAREVGLRKVIGATRVQLALQFILEAFIINFFALLFSALLVVAATPFFDAFTGKQISATFAHAGMWGHWSLWAGCLAVFVLGALQVGAFPALALSAYKPITVLKGKIQLAKGSVPLRKVLVGFQFTMSIVLIAGTVTVYKQLSYMRNQDLGYNQEQLLVVKAPAVTDSTFQSKTALLKTQLAQNPSVTAMAPSSEIPGKRIFANNSIRNEGQEKAQNFITNLQEIDHDFLPTYQIPLAAGHNLMGERAANIFEARQGKVLVNETLAKRLGFRDNESALGNRIIFASWFGDITGEIVGVVKDYHQRSLKDKMSPILYYYNSISPWNYYSVRLKTADAATVLPFIEDRFKALFPGNAFESFFLDDYFNRQYLSDQRFGKIFGFFTGLAIFVACLGLIGLSTYNIKLRTKEIGIRRVLGATSQGIVYLFSKDFVKLTLIAALIACPAVYFFAGQWLGNFAFHIPLSWYIFVLPPLALMCLAVLATGIQSLKASLVNPVKSLRNE